MRLYSILSDHSLYDYHKKVHGLLIEYRQLEKSGNTVQLKSKKNVGTLFRKIKKTKRGLNMDCLDGIIKLNKENYTIDVGARTTFHTITLETLKHNLMPKVLPELSSITVGGAISGVGLESSSFKYGWVHDAVVSMDVLVADGKIVTCTADNVHKDLFHAMPNSYGTLGYITRVKLQLMKTKPYVQLRNNTFTNATAAFNFMEGLCKYNNETHITGTDKTVDFIDAVAFSKDNIVVAIGKFTNVGIGCSHYPSDGIYYKSLTEKSEDRLSVYDYCWRWDSDMFWGTEGMFLLQNKWVRRIFGRSLFNTPVLRTLNILISKYRKMYATYWSKKTPSKRVSPLYERIIQDIGIPMKKTPDFFDWLDKKINVYPVWLCPIKPKDSSDNTYAWNLNDGQLYFDIAIFGKKKTDEDPKHAYYNKLIEEKMLELDGNKSFYSDTYFTDEQFNKVIETEKYKEVKAKYDRDNKFMNLYDKVISLSLIHI